MKADVFVLHGFLGLPTDWGFGKEVNYFHTPTLDPSVDLDTWGENFCTFAKKHSQSFKRVLVGYSLGGRLALHALKADPKMWTKVVLLSTHLGLVAAKDQEERILSDEIWAKRFETEDWKTLMAAWNSQEIFQNSWEPSRFEEDFDRNKLAAALRMWSLGRQRDFRPFLSKIETPWVSLTGQNDPRFTQLWKQFAGPTQHLVVPGAGHRLIFEKSLKLSSLVGL